MLDSSMHSISCCTRDSRMCPGHWDGLLESSQRKTSTSTPAMRQSRKIPRQQVWYLTWRRPSVFTRAQLRTDWITEYGYSCSDTARVNCSLWRRGGEGRERLPLLLATNFGGLRDNLPTAVSLSVATRS